MKTKEEKWGEDGEKSFAKWLSDESIGYLHVNQSTKYFSEVFTKHIKRPDFLVLLPSMGFIAVDVKHYTFNNSNTFTLNVPNELAKSAEFERVTRFYLWYAYKKKNVSDDTWYFISAHDAYAHGEVRNNKGTAEDFLVIDVEHFTSLQGAKDFGKLFDARLGISGKLSRGIENMCRRIRT